MVQLFAYVGLIAIFFFVQRAIGRHMDKTSSN